MTTQHERNMVRRQEVDRILDEIQAEAERLLKLIKGERDIGLVTWRVTVARQGQSVIEALNKLIDNHVPAQALREDGAPGTSGYFSMRD
jgi:hypothetical protein